ncbi:MAG: hypothetical protein ACU836_02055 [Gammaproteobacteria bacterium]
MKHDFGDCAVCRMMRSLAYSGLGMVLGAGIAYILDGGKVQMVYTGIAFAFIFVFALLKQKK